MFQLLKQIVKTGIKTTAYPDPDDALRTVAQRLQSGILRNFAGSLTIRHVDAGSCNGCELEIIAMNNPIYNCERYGIQFTASPRFADLLLVTGPVAFNMEIALRRTYAATPGPKLVVAVGDCGRDGGIFGTSYASLGGVAGVIPVDVVVPGCPPTPVELLHGLLAAVEGGAGQGRDRDGKHGYPTR